MTSQVKKIVEHLSKTPMGKVLVLGDVMLDEYVTCKTEFSIAESIKKLRVKENRFFLGGAANVANNIAALRAEVLLLGVLGQDLEAAIFLELSQHICDPSLLLQDEKRVTTLKTRFNTDDGETIRVDKECDFPIRPEMERELVKRLSVLLDDVSCIVLSDYNKGVVEQSLVETVISLAKPLGKPVIVDPKGRQPDKYRGATLLTPNLKEFNDMTRSSFTEWSEAISVVPAFLDEYELDCLILKDSSAGSVLINKQCFHHVPALCRHVSCTIGAGDSLIAGLALGMIKGMGIEGAFLLANLTSSLAVASPYTTTVTFDDILAHLDWLGEVYQT